MIDMNLYLLKPLQAIKKEHAIRQVHDEFFINHSDNCFISIGNEEVMKKYFSPSKRLFTEALLVWHDGKQLTDFHFCETNLLPELVELAGAYMEKNADVQTRINQSQLDVEYRRIDGQNVRLYATKGEDELVNAVVPEQEFFWSLLQTCEHYFLALAEYGTEKDHFHKKLMRLEKFYDRYKKSYA
ncbi:hypothetical protein [Brevibacillus gelatini]|uniref:Uncharacterized protein n=1 Tax=Brevibacillus gelatini TaxID=1655277 RepID=A0A3M8B9X7_9BACL|nr:hypothetical protein [Brevibacillus gelatini]RNB60254.1 hypothetical protein EDM57_02830 [Brevibacillus gelatini]